MGGKQASKKSVSWFQDAPHQGALRWTRRQGEQKMGMMSEGGGVYADVQ
jgi:hypothetical protein